MAMKVAIRWEQFISTVNRLLTPSSGVWKGAKRMANSSRWLRATA
jgi:hypothetical protein